MNSKTVTITRFRLPEGTKHEILKKGFEEVAPAFAKVPGLIQKAFLVSADGRYAGGTYLWESEELARAFSENVVRDMIRKRFNTDCEIEYFSAPVLVQGETRIEPE
jgi:hypothetical protein